MKPTLVRRCRRDTIALVVPAMVAIVSPHASAQQPVNWIRKNAIPLRTVEAGNGFNDMQPLKKVVGDARIVALGEATHGTREFFQLKHRMIEFLASQMGFTIFSIEANMPEAYRLNDFVLNGNGDPKQGSLKNFDFSCPKQI
jgi:erythromycin esterase